MTERLHYEVHDGTGPPALLVHGIMGSRGFWVANLAALSTACTPVVVELFGHGRSPTPMDRDAYTPAGYVAQFERIRGELGVERWSMIGQSLGAALTLRYCLDQPDRVLGHVFTNSAVALGDDQWSALLAEVAEPEAARIEMAGRPGLRAIPWNVGRSATLAASVRTALDADEGLLDPRGIANTVRWTVPAASVRSRLASSRVRTLLVVGAGEPAFEDGRRHIEAHLPSLDVVALPCGHVPNAELPDDFNRVVVDFLRGGRPAADDRPPVA